MNDSINEVASPRRAASGDSSVGGNCIGSPTRTARLARRSGNQAFGAVAWPASSRMERSNGGSDTMAGSDDAVAVHNTICAPAIAPCGDQVNSGRYGVMWGCVSARAHGKTRRNGQPRGHTKNGLKVRGHIIGAARHVPRPDAPLRLQRPSCPYPVGLGLQLERERCRAPMRLLQAVYRPTSCRALMIWRRAVAVATVN
eukprot:scaffold88131_cov30-Tisochrysis_lutea.AAC.4